MQYICPNQRLLSFYLRNTSISAEMKIKKLMPMDAESRRLIDWMEKGETCPELIHCLLLLSEMVSIPLIYWVPRCCGIIEIDVYSMASH